MKKMTFIPAALFVSTFAMSSGALAHDNNHNECNLNLDNGVTVTPDFLKVFDGDKELYVIERDGSMTVDGKVVSLSADDQKVSAAYANGIRKAVPEAVEIATNAMEMATKGVNTALTALFGDNSEIEHQVNRVIERAQEVIDENINHANGEYTIAPHSFDNLEQAFDEEFEREIEKVAMNSMGNVFTLLGQAMNEGEGTFEQRMEAFGERMEKMGEDLEATMEAQAEQMEAQAEQLCMELKDIDELESQLQRNVPEFAKYELLDMEEHKRYRYDDGKAE